MRPPLVNGSEIGPGQTASQAPVLAPRPGWPDKSTLDYHKVLIELLLLVLAVPWILRQLVKNPAKASHEAAASHLKGA